MLLYGAARLSQTAPPACKWSTESRSTSWCSTADRFHPVSAGPCIGLVTIAAVSRLGPRRPHGWLTVPAHRGLIVYVCLSYVNACPLGRTRRCGFARSRRSSLTGSRGSPAQRSPCPRRNRFGRAPHLAAAVAAVTKSRVRFFARCAARCILRQACFGRLADSDAVGSHG